MLITQLEPAGAQKAMLQLAKKMIEAGHHVDVAAMYDKSAYQYDFEKQYELPINVFKMKDLNSGLLSNAFRFIRGGWVLYQFMATGGYDVIQTFTHYSNIVGIPLSWMSGIPVRVSNQAVTTDYLPIFVQWLDRVIANSKLTSRMVAVSETTLNDSVKRVGISPSKILRIYNAVGLPNRVIDSYSRESFGLSDDTFVGVVVARLSPVKGHMSIIRMLSKYKNDIPNLRFLFLGEGEMRRQIELEIKKNNLESIIQMLGNRNDVYQILVMADFFILPSYREGLPMSVIEAMLLGVPICASAVDGNIEALEDGRGLTFNPDDIAGMYECISKIKNDYKWCAVSKRKAKDFARAKFDLDVHVTRHIALYTELLQSKH